MVPTWRGSCPGSVGAQKAPRPKVADRLPVAVEHVQHRPLMAFRGLSEVVAVIGGAGRGQQAQSAPAALAGEGENALQRRLPGDREVDALGDVLRRTLELIEQGGARWARALRQGQQRRLTPLRARPLVTAVMRQIVLPYLAELGDRWERGDASIAQAHFASNLIRSGWPGWYAAGATGAARGPSWPARPGSGTTWP